MPKTELTVAELLSVQAMRILDENKPIPREELDNQLALSQEPAGSSADMAAKLVKRAEGVLEAELGIGAEQLSGSLITLQWVRWILVAVAVVVAAGGAAVLAVMDSKTPVQLLLLFIGYQALLGILWPILSMVYGALRSDSGMPSLKGVSWIWFSDALWLRKFLMKRFGLSSSSSDWSRNNQLAEKLIQYTITPVCNLYSACCHLCMGTIGIIVLSKTAYALFNAPVDYVWEDSLTLPDTKTIIVEYVGWPFRAIIDLPTIEDVLVLNDLEAAKSKIVASRIRWSWFLLTAILFYGVLPRFFFAALNGWMVKRSWNRLRRKLAGEISGECPTPYYTKTLERLKPRQHSTTEPPLPDPKPQEPKPEPELLHETTGRTNGTDDGSTLAGAVTSPREDERTKPSPKPLNTVADSPNPSGDEPKLLASNPSTPDSLPKTLRTPELIPQPHPVSSENIFPDLIVFSYEVFPQPLSKTPWKESLPLPQSCRVQDFGDVNGAPKRKSLLSQMPDRIGPNTVVAFLMKMAKTPDEALLRFLRDLLKLVGSENRLLIIATNGDELRAFVENDGDKVRQRLDLLKRECAKIGIPSSCIFDGFDHANATPVSRSVLQLKIESLLDNSEFAGDAHALRLAGHFSTAIKQIRDSVHHAKKDSSDEDRRQQILDLHRKLHDLYANEVRTFEAFSQRFQQQAADFVENAAAQSERVAEVAAAAREQFQRAHEFCMASGDFWKHLRGKWGIGGAAAGFSLAVLGAVAVGPAALAAMTTIGIPAVLANGFVGGTAMQAVPILTVAGGLVGAAWPVKWPKLFANDSSTESPAGASEAQESSFDMDDLVRPSVVLALVLELQGNSTNCIATRIGMAVNDLAPEPLTTLPEVESLLDTAEQRVRSWSDASISNIQLP